MPYNKDKQQAFQAAQQGYEQAINVNETAVQSMNDGVFGKELKHLKEEVQEAYQQIDKALTVASEHQVDQLREYKNNLSEIMNQIEQ